ARGGGRDLHGGAGSVRLGPPRLDAGGGSQAVGGRADRRLAAVADQPAGRVSAPSAARAPVGPRGPRAAAPAGGRAGRPSGAAAPRPDVGEHPLRGAGHHKALAARAPAAAPRDADGLPGPVLVAEPAQDGGPDRRRSVPDSPPGARGTRPRARTPEPRGFEP